jgi:phosphatidate cytidylyltransferase
MNETLKRGISGAVFIALLITSILYATESFILLFGVFLLIATYEFCGLIKVNRVLPIAFVTLFYT